MAAAAEGWRDSAGCRLCGKPARTEGEKQRLPSSIVECTLSMDKPDSDWLHRACRSKVTKSASVARREPVPPAPRRSSRGRAPDPVPDPVRAAQGGWQGDEQMLASSLGSFWDEQPGTGAAAAPRARALTARRQAPLPDSGFWVLDSESGQRTHSSVCSPEGGTIRRSITHNPKTRVPDWPP